MGYLVVTYVDSIDAARVMTNSVPEVGGVFENARVVGVYRMPHRDEPVCPGSSGGCKAEGWTRVPRRGYMAHSCGLRNRDYRQTLSRGLMDTFGINLLPRNKTPKIFRNPETWDRK